MADNSSPSPNPIKPNSQLMEAQLPPPSSMAAPPNSDLAQIPNNGGGNQSGNLMAAANYQMQNMQRSSSMSRLTPQQQQQLLMRQQAQNQQVQNQQAGMYGQMNFGGVQNQQQQMGNLARSGYMGQSANLPMLSGQPSAQFNMPAQYLSSPRQKAALMQGGAQLNNAGQALQGMQGMQGMQGVQGMQGMQGMANLNPQLRSNVTAAAYAQAQAQAQAAQQRMTPTQLRQQLVQSGLATNQTQQGRASYPQLSALAQNGQPALMQNSLTQQQQQWSKQISGISPSSPSYRVQQQRQHQILLQQHMNSSGQLNQGSPVLSQQQLSQLVQQMGHPQQQSQAQAAQQAQVQAVQQQQVQAAQGQVAQQQQQPQQPQQQQAIQQQQQQAILQQQQLMQQQQQQSPRTVAPSGQKSLSLTGSQPDATASGTTTPGGSSSQGTEASNQLLGKRRIQDLVSQVDPQGRLDPEVEDYFLQLADDFINQVTQQACNLAKHRNSKTVEAKDVLLLLEKNYNLTVPGFSSEEKQDQQNYPSGDAHQKRMDVVRAMMESSTSGASSSGEMPSQAPANNQAGKSQMTRPPSSDQLGPQSSQMNRF